MANVIGRSQGYVWDTGTLTWIPAQQGTGGGGGGGGDASAANQVIGNASLATLVGQAVPTSVAMLSAATSGTGVTLPVIGFSSAAIQFIFTGDGAAVVEGTSDDTNWVGIHPTRVLDLVAGDGSGPSPFPIQSSGIYSVNVAGLSKIRARIISSPSGINTISATGLASLGSALASVDLNIAKVGGADITGNPLPALIQTSDFVGVSGANTAPSGSEYALITRNIPSGTQNIADGGGSLTVDGSVAVSGISGNVTVVQPTGTNLHVVVDSAPTTAVTGPLTDTQLRASAVPVSQSGTWTVQPGNTANTTAWKVDGSAVTQPVSNAGLTNLDVALSTRLKPADTLTKVATVDTITNAVTVAQGTATSLKTQAENYQGGSAVAAGNPLQVTLANTGANATAVKVDGSAVTQPVSGTVAVSGSVAVTGPLTDTQLRASAVPVSQSGTWTVQPGNTANTTAWKVDASSVAVPVTDNGGSLTIDNANLDVALSTRLKAADTLAAVTTVGTITNVVHVDDNAGSLTVDNPNLDVALSTRLKPADTLAAVTTVGTITNVVHVDDNTGSLTVDNNGTFAVQTQDGSGNLLTSLTGAPVGTERGLSVRPIQTQRVGAAGNLGVLNGFAEVLVDGYSTVSGHIAPTAFTGQLACQYTLDGTNYSFTTFVRRDNLQRVLLVTFVGSSTAIDFSLTPPAGATKIRFINVAYTSGACSATAYASTHMDALLLNANAQPTGTAILVDLPTEVGGPDDSGLMRPIQLRASTPLSTDYGLVSRVIFPTPGDSFSGVSGPLMQAAVSDARESYYDGRIEPLSMTSDGRLRVSSSSADTTMLLTFNDELTSDACDSIFSMSNPFF